MSDPTGQPDAEPGPRPSARAASSPSPAVGPDADAGAGAPPLVRAFLGLGANLGDPRAQIAAALDAMDDVTSVSGLYRSAPVGGPRQPPFLNLVTELATAAGPYALLERCARLEQAARRRRVVHWGPRTLDIDVLLYGDWVSDDPRLTVPHPRMDQRRFVLEPLAEIAPDLVTADRLDAVADQHCERIADCC